MKTYIESTTKERFATRFAVLEDGIMTDEYVVVMKLTKNDMSFLVHRYRMSATMGYEDLGTVRMTEEKFFEEFKPHANYKKTSLREFSDKLADSLDPSSTLYHPKVRSVGKALEFGNVTPRKKKKC